MTADHALLMLCLTAAFGLFCLLHRLSLRSKAAAAHPQRVELTDGYVLCQDCGHVEPYTADRHQGREACSQCGGDFCGCTACSELARMALQFQDPGEASQVKDTPASRTRRAESEASEHRTGEDVAKRILDPPPTSQPP